MRGRPRRGLAAARPARPRRQAVVPLPGALIPCGSRPTEEQLAVQRTARDFAERRLRPRAGDRDATGEFPEAELRELAELGLLGVAVDEDLGGAAAGAVAYSLAMQELARGDASVAVAVSVTNMVAELIAKVGDDAQRTPPRPQGRPRASTWSARSRCPSPRPAATRPGMRTTATRIDGGWRLDGAKQWITSGDRAGILVVWAVTDAGAGHKGITAFLVPAARPG